MRRTLTLVAWLAFALTSSAATYYIDATGGSDLNNGLATVTPWQHHPFMANWGGTYVHTAGDGFIFKGGETWGHASFPWHITAGGDSLGNIDGYGTDVTWYTGASFSPPVFDVGGTELPGGYDVMVLFDSATQPHDIVMDNLTFTSLYWSGNKAYGWVSYFNLQTSYNITVTRCQFLNWTHAGSPTTDQLKVIQGANSAPFNPGCNFTSCTFDGVNTPNATQGQSSGEASYAFSGNFYNCTVRNIASGFIVTGDPFGFGQTVSGCEIGPTYMSYDSGAHPDGLFMNGGNLFYWHDNLMHDNWVETVFMGNGSGAEQVYLYNNVIWNCKTSPALIENNFYAGAQLYVWNNTIESGSLYCIRNVNRGVGPLGVLDMRNNLFITDAGVLLQDPGASITTLIDQNNVTLSTGSAFVQGYSEANLFQPTSTNVPTFNSGQDLSAQLFGALTTDRLGVIRPQVAIWDSGAYEFVPNANPGVVALSTAAQTTCETCGFVGITLIRTGGTAGNVTVTASTVDGTAIAGHDYTSVNFVAQWADGETGARSFQISILNSGDTGTTNRAFTVVLSAPTGGVTIGSPATETVSVALTQPPQVDFGSVTFAPVSYSTVPTAGTVTLSVLRNGSTNVALALNYATANGTATAGTDYTTTSGSLSWATNDNSAKTFTVPIIASGATGAPRTFTVTLSGFTPPGVTVGTATATVTIVLPPIVLVPGTIAFAAASTVVSENSANVSITVVRADGSDGPVSVTAATANQTATAGHDYTAVTTNLVWGDTVLGGQTFVIPLLASGDTATTNRTFLVTLLAPGGGAVLASPSNEVVTILMNPPQPTNGGTFAFSAPNYATTLTNGTVTITVTRSGSTNEASSVNYTTMNGTALAGTDYTATGGTLSWTANDNSSQTFTVPILNSGATGPQRLFTVALSNPTGTAKLGLAMATVSIQLAPRPGVLGLIVLDGPVNARGSVGMRGH